MKKTVYLSGPISDIEGGNYTAFAKMQEDIEALGYNVLNPHEICQHIDPSLYTSPEEHWEACMRACLSQLPMANILVTLKNWEQSKGAKKEVAIARETGFIDVEFCLNFIKRHNGELN